MSSDVGRCCAPSPRRGHRTTHATLCDFHGALQSLHRPIQQADAFLSFTLWPGFKIVHRLITVSPRSNVSRRESVRFGRPRQKPSQPIRLISQGTFCATEATRTKTTISLACRAANAMFLCVEVCILVVVLCLGCGT